MSQETKEIKRRGPYNKSPKQEAKEAIKRSAVRKVPVKSHLIEVVAYSKPKSNPKKSRTTVAGIIDTKTNKIYIHGARNNTSMKEVFKRPVGRQVALGRARKCALLVIDFEPGKAREAFHAAANILMRKPYKISGKLATKVAQ